MVGTAILSPSWDQGIILKGLGEWEPRGLPPSNTVKLVSSKTPVYTDVRAVQVLQRPDSMWHLQEPENCDKLSMFSRMDAEAGCPA